MKSDQKANGNNGWLKGCCCLILDYPVLLIIGVFIIGDPHEDPYGMWAMSRLISCDSDFQGWGRRDFQEKYQIIPKGIDGRCP